MLNVLMMGPDGVKGQKKGQEQDDPISWMLTTQTPSLHNSSNKRFKLIERTLDC